MENSDISDFNNRRKKSTPEIRGSRILNENPKKSYKKSASSIKFKNEELIGKYSKEFNQDFTPSKKLSSKKNRSLTPNKKFSQIKPKEKKINEIKFNNKRHEFIFEILK